jgi:hypothetical protein
MPRNKLYTMVGLAVLLVLVSAMAFVARTSSNANVAVVSNDRDLEVPAANMKLSANWQAKPASGAAVTLPYANIRVNTDSSKEAQNEPFVAVDPNNPNHLVVGRTTGWPVMGTSRYTPMPASMAGAPGALRSRTSTAMPAA